MSDDTTTTATPAYCSGCMGPCGACNDEEVLITFRNAVSDMRELQKSYFKARTQGNPRASAILTEAKNAERMVDNMIRLLSAPREQNLFDQRQIKDIL